jgi:ubiquitin carboxyl-terminal hydrolase 7
LRLRVLSRKMTYDQFAKKVGEHLQVDETHLRFAPVMASTHAVQKIIVELPSVRVKC